MQPHLPRHASLVVSWVTIQKVFEKLGCALRRPFINNTPKPPLTLPFVRSKFPGGKHLWALRNLDIEYYMMGSGLLVHYTDGIIPYASNKAVTVDLRHKSRFIRISFRHYPLRLIQYYHYFLIRVWQCQLLTKIVN